MEQYLHNRGRDGEETTQESFLACGKLGKRSLDLKFSFFFLFFFLLMPILE